MQRQSNLPELKIHRNDDERYDLDALLHPANAFGHPSDVVNDTDLTLSEKRAILASWASDVCAVESTPALRRAPGRPPVGFDDIIDALRELDRCADIPRIPHYKRVLVDRRPGVFGRKGRRPVDFHGSSLN
jgi:hypothetical protein